MKTKPQKPNPSAPCALVDVWPLLAAYTDLAERHSALLIKRLEEATAAAKAHRAAEIDASVEETLNLVAEAINKHPGVSPYDFFKL